MGAIYYKGEKYGAMPASAANLPYDAGSQDSTKDKIDSKADSSNVYTTSQVDTLLASKANKEIVTLSFTSTNDGIYVIPTTIIPLSKYPVFAWEETELQNYAFPITNYRHSNWTIWCRIAGTWAIEPNKAFTVKVLVLS